jgi:hypothetical protein
MSSYRVRGVLIAVAMGIAAAAAHAACPPATVDGTVVSKGELVLAYRPVANGGKGAKPGEIPMAQHFALEVHLCEKGAASTALLHKTDASMPEHKHGMNYRPVITSLGAGRFRVEGMMFHMAGHWELAFEVHAGKETVRLTHDVQVE